MQKNNIKKAGSRKKAIELPESGATLWMRAMEENFNALNYSLREMDSGSQKVEGELQKVLQRTALEDKAREYLQLESALQGKENERLQLEMVLQGKENERLHLEIKLRSSQERVSVLENQISKQQADIRYWIDEDNRHQVELKSVYASTSWRMTAPVRKISDLGRSIFPLRTLPKRAALKMIRSVSNWIIVHPNVDRVVIVVVNRFPAIKNRLKRIVYGVTPPAGHLMNETEEYLPMSPEVKSIYMDLVTKINENEQVKK